MYAPLISDAGRKPGILYLQVDQEINSDSPFSHLLLTC